MSRNLLTVLRDIPNRLNKIQETICYESVIYLVINANTLLSPSPFAATKAAVGKLLSWAKPNDANMSFWSFLQREKLKKTTLICVIQQLYQSFSKSPRSLHQRSLHWTNVAGALGMNVKRIKKNINWGIISWSNTTFSEPASTEMYGRQ